MPTTRRCLHIHQTIHDFRVNKMVIILQKWKTNPTKQWNLGIDVELEPWVVHRECNMRKCGGNLTTYWLSGRSVHKGGKMMMVEITMQPKNEIDAGSPHAYVLRPQNIIHMALKLLAQHVAMTKVTFTSHECMYHWTNYDMTLWGREGTISKPFSHYFNLRASLPLSCRHVYTSHTFFN